MSASSAVYGHLVILSTSLSGSLHKYTSVVCAFACTHACSVWQRVFLDTIFWFLLRVSTLRFCAICQIFSFTSFGEHIFSLLHALNLSAMITPISFKRQLVVSVGVTLKGEHFQVIWSKYSFARNLANQIIESFCAEFIGFVHDSYS